MKQADQQLEPAGQRASPRVRHLLAVARTQFVSHGFDAVSIDAIARTAGVSKETIYRHFADKEALFRAALEEAGDEFTARALAVHDGAPTTQVELAGLARAILDSALDEGMFGALFVAVGVLHRMPDLAQGLTNGQWRAMEPVREALEHYARDRGIERDVGLEIALDFGSLAVGGPALLMGFAEPEGGSREQVAGRVAALFAQGVGGALRPSTRTPSIEIPPSPTPTTELPLHIRTLLDVAANQFFACGYDGANLDTVGAEARVGRGTLYRHFGSKAGLFGAAMRTAAALLAHAAEPPPLADARDRDRLVGFLEMALESLASLSSISLHRAVISESRRDAALAREVYAIVRAPWVQPLAGWLTNLGLTEAQDWYARQLLVLALRGNRLLAGGQPPSQEERRHYATRAVTIFLDGFISAL